MARDLVAAVGVLLVVATASSAICALRRNSFLARGGRRIRRQAHPVLFAANLVGAALALVLGAGLLAWALAGL